MTAITYHASAAAAPTAYELAVAEAQRLAARQVTTPPLVDRHGGVEAEQRGEWEDNQ